MMLVEWVAKAVERFPASGTATVEQLDAAAADKSGAPAIDVGAWVLGSWA
jgi:hypothetical protein